MSLKLSGVAEFLGAHTSIDVFVSAWFSLVWTLLPIEVVGIGHVLDQSLFILANFPTLATFETIDFTCHVFLIVILSEMVLIMHVPQKSRLVFIVISTDFAPELEVLTVLLLLLHHLLVRSDTLPQITLVDVPREDMLILTDFATFTFEPALDEFILSTSRFIAFPRLVRSYLI